MRLCIPAKTNEGYDAAISPSFVHANYFVIYDTEFKYLRVIKNRIKHHNQVQGSPRELIQREHVQAVIGSRIPGKALNSLNHSGIKTYWTDDHSIRDVIDHLNQNLTHPLETDMYSQ